VSRRSSPRRLLQQLVHLDIAGVGDRDQRQVAGAQPADHAVLVLDADPLRLAVIEPDRADVVIADGGDPRRGALMGPSR